MIKKNLLMQNDFKKEIKIFLASLMFFTRIPVKLPDENLKNYFNQSSRYLTIIGIIVGCFSSIIYFISLLFLSSSISIIFSILSSMLITGCFHEDGIADVCDSFGGGFSKEKIMTIMKDSNIGTFGTIGLIITILLKYQALIEIKAINILNIGLIMIAGHSVSRFAAILIMYISSYVTSPNMSKAKAVIKKLSNYDLAFSAFGAILPFFFIFKLYIFFSLIPIFMSAFIMHYYFKKKIGGYTGDCLGAVQQVTEIIFYIFATTTPQ